MFTGIVRERGRVVAARRNGDGLELRIAAPETAEGTSVGAEKGPLAVDGVSLTIAGLADDGVEIALVPHTLAATTLGALQPGDPVNLEVDVLAKYVERLSQR